MAGGDKTAKQAHLFNVKEINQSHSHSLAAVLALDAARRRRRRPEPGSEERKEAETKKPLTAAMSINVKTPRGIENMASNNDKSSIDSNYLIYSLASRLQSHRMSHRLLSNDKDSRR